MFHNIAVGDHFKASLQDVYSPHRRYHAGLAKFVLVLALDSAGEFIKVPVGTSMLEVAQSKYARSW